MLQNLDLVVKESFMFDMDMINLNFDSNKLVGKIQDLKDVFNNDHVKRQISSIYFFNEKNLKALVKQLDVIIQLISFFEICNNQRKEMRLNLIKSIKVSNNLNNLDISSYQINIPSQKIKKELYNVDKSLVLNKLKLHEELKSKMIDKYVNIIDIKQYVSKNKEIEVSYSNENIDCVQDNFSRKDIINSVKPDQSIVIKNQSERIKEKRAIQIEKKKALRKSILKDIRKTKIKDEEDINSVLNSRNFSHNKQMSSSQITTTSYNSNIKLSQLNENKLSEQKAIKKLKK